MAVLRSEIDPAREYWISGGRVGRGVSAIGIKTASNLTVDPVTSPLGYFLFGCAVPPEFDVGGIPTEEATSVEDVGRLLDPRHFGTGPFG